MKHATLSEVERLVMLEVQRSIVRRGHPPSHAELQEALVACARTDAVLARADADRYIARLLEPAEHWLAALVAKGYLARHPRNPRALTVLQRIADTLPKPFGCQVCGATVLSKATHRSYCSRKCKRQRAYELSDKKRNRESRREWELAKARDPEWAAADRARHREARVRFEARARAKRLKARPARPCPECRTPFVPLVEQRLYCTELCRMRAAKRRYWQAYSDKLNERRKARRAAAREQVA